ncbi:MAG: tyrosyl-tRNA synthetase [archaeon GW2011_AR3]|nr:MAG: tyrosyl-tRNA synthetase [archaeon GW2011_AR3]MBS3109394.1 tyrosine--tRNA ligase [Candidatus Woesearchaeota archaeon]
MDIENRLELIRQVGEEIVTEEEMRELLSSKKGFIAYDGFEPSGNVHIAQAIMRTININKMVEAGAKFKVLVADWHAWANNKLGGNLENIQTVGEYMIETWKACGLETAGVEFVWANELVKDEDYWKTVMKVAVNNTVKRVIRCSQIMGRSESDNLSASQIFYPCMQAADIFYLKADLCQLGVDQRKVNMLAREVGPKLGYWKPIIVSHHMLMGLGQPPLGKTAEEKATQMKMSKSNPDSAIFMTDSEEQIKAKIKKAYCPEKVVEENPTLEYCKYMIFEKFDAIRIERPEKYGGNIDIGSYAELEGLFTSGGLHPVDLKNAVASKLNEIISPVREHFVKNKKAAELKEKVSKILAK